MYIVYIVYTHVQVQCHIKLKLFVPATPGTLLRIFLCSYSPLSLSPCWGCGSAPPTGRGLHSGWLSGSSLSTVFSVTRSIAMYCPLYPLLQSMQVHMCTHLYNTCAHCMLFSKYPNEDMFKHSRFTLNRLLYFQSFDQV